MTAPSFATVGRNAGTIDVQISYRIIELFSEGLYSSPNKALEELVANSFDAGASHVHVVLPLDFTTADATIAVIDDGEGMDKAGFQQHWLIGTSNKRRPGFVPPKGRSQIGKFGIGKLATYVLANRLSHISKRNGKYLATSMDYGTVPHGHDEGIVAKKPIPITLRELTEEQARRETARWMEGEKAGHRALKLFGRGAAESWTVAVLSDLKPMAAEIQRGRLRWVLSTAMPLRDDFELYLDGEKIEPAKLKQKRLKRWVLGKDLKELPKPAPDSGEVSTDEAAESGSPTRYGLVFPALGRVTGYIELFQDPIDTGKSEAIERSNGFFVYVRGRLINVDDPGFGIDRNKLRHGTFSRFRMVIHADGLDDELRSSRESLRVGPLFNLARDIAHGGFNAARTELDKVEGEESPSAQVARRVGASSALLTRRPIASLLDAAFHGKYSPRYLIVPVDLKPAERETLLETIRGDEFDTTEPEEIPSLVTSSALVESLSQDQPIAVFDVRTGTLQINGLHPFVAYFLDDYEDRRKSVPLELLAMSEVVLEALLFQSGASSAQVADTLANRDLLLRQLARSTGKRNARLVAQALEDAGSDQSQLELELVAASDSMGFDAIPLGGPKKPDGRAEAWLSAGPDGTKRGYAVSLEAKSKEKPGAKVSAKTVGISAIGRQREDFKCDHAIVVAYDFPTSQGETSALAKEIEGDRKAYPGKTITLIRLKDMARLVRLVPLKRVGLDRIRELLTTCRLPEEAAAWVQRLADEKQGKPPYKDILEIIQEEQKAQVTELVEFGTLRGALRRARNIEMTRDEVLTACRALANWVPQWVTVHQNHVEIHTRPDKILDAVRTAIDEYPENERRLSAK